jgi:hypothetical protein
LSDCSRQCSSSVSNHWIGAAIQYVHLRVPEVNVLFGVLCILLLLPLDLRHALLLLIPHAGVLVCGLATNQEGGRRIQGNELKPFHI